MSLQDLLDAVKASAPTPLGLVDLSDSPVQAPSRADASTTGPGGNAIQNRSLVPRDHTVIGPRTATSPAGQPR